jgi:hypothetical protein
MRIRFRSYIILAQQNFLKNGASYLRGAQDTLIASLIESIFPNAIGWVAHCWARRGDFAPVMATIMYQYRPLGYITYLYQSLSGRDYCTISTNCSWVMTCDPAVGSG